MGSVRQDFRYAFRNLGKAPGFTAVVVLTLALGIGASAAIFSVLENLLMEPFPYTDAQRYMHLQVHDTDRNEPGGRTAFSGPEFLDFAAQNHVFDRVIATDRLDVLYRSGEGTHLLNGNWVTPGTFEFLGVTPLLGRVLLPADYEPGAPPVFVLRYKTWVKEFGADSTILNKTFSLNGTARTLVGIMPPRFGWGDAELWIPEKPARVSASTLLPGGSPRHFWFLVGHLKPGVSLKEATTDLTNVAERLATVYPNDYPKHFTVQIESLTDLIVGRFRSTLYIVLAAVVLLLLIGCGNVANLLLARATAREKEFAIRFAIGASRGRLVGQLMVESMVLAFGGALVGTFLGWGGLKFLVALMPQDIIPAETVIRLNAPVLLFTLGVTILTAHIFGLAPALKSTRKDLNEPLRDNVKANSGGGRHGAFRKALVVLEVALSLILLVSAGLLLRSFIALREVHLGFQPDHVLFARLPLPVQRYRTADQIAAYYGALLQRLKTLPGVVAAAETSALPPYGGLSSEVDIAGRTHAEKWASLVQLCSEDYFQVLKIQLLEGRFFTAAESNDARKLAVVNRTFVKRYLRGENAIGRQVTISGLATLPDRVAEPVFEIIGVAADASNHGLQLPPDPEIWIPYTVTGSGFRGILVRTTQKPLAMLNLVRHEVWATDSNVALTRTDSLEGYISQFSYAGPRFGSILMGVFGFMGLILVSIGVYSMLSYITARRTQEIGVRMALGAKSSDVLRMVIGTGLKLVAIGVVLGLLVSFALGRIIATQLWGVSAYDPLTLALVPLFPLVAGLLACWLPARRAARVDPLIALRYE